MASLLERGIQSPRTSSAGRLFDAVASIVGLQQHVHFEGQAAMALQFAGDPTIEDGAYPVSVASASEDPERSPQSLTADWAPMLIAILDDLTRGVPVSRVSARFHNGLVEAIVRVSVEVGCEQVALSGGCFQNAWLLERAVQRLRQAGLRPYWHQRIPPNDGGIALGQVVAAIRQRLRKQ
jgi:hydrogenase maturation protein HypF